MRRDDLDGLPVWIAPRPASPASFDPLPVAPDVSVRPPRRWRLGRLPTVLLVLLLVVTGSLQVLLDEYAHRLVLDRRDRADAAAPDLVNRPADQTTTYQAAPPTASGASPAYPLNHTFDANAITLAATAPNHDFETAPTTLGVPPANHQFDTAPTDQGVQLVNHDFAAGDFTGWTPESGGTTVQTVGGPDGAWARMTGTTSTLTTAAFTPEADAQVVTFDLGQLSTTTGNIVGVHALSGPTHGTVTSVGYFTCANCDRWSVGTLTISAFRGQSIKLKFIRSSGAIGIDRVRKQVVLPGYEATGDLARRLDGAAQDPYAEVGDILTSSPFTVEPTAQVGTVRLKGLTPVYNDQAYLYVLSGAGYATRTRLVPQPLDTWTTFRFNLGAWLGGSVKLQLDVIGGRMGIDDVGLQRVDFAGWTAVGTTAPVAGQTGGTAARLGDTMTSAAFVLPADAQQLTIRYKTGDTGLYWDLLTGPTYSTVFSLSGGILVPSAAWSTAKVGVSTYAGQSVKLRLSPQLQAVTVDDVGVPETVVPGWTGLDNAALSVGEDASGTYATAFQANGAIALRSSVINPGVVYDSGSLDSRSYVLGYAIGAS